MSLRQAAKDKRRERILSAATRMFVAKGFAGTTIRQIARKARVATGTIFNYAPDKQALLAMVFCREVETVQARAIEEIDADAPFEHQLLTVFGAFYRYYGREPELSRVFLKELMFSSQQLPQVATATHGFMEAVATVVTRAQERGELRTDVPPPQAAAILFTVYWGCLVAWLGGALPSQAEALAQLERSLLLVLDGLRAGARRHRPGPR